MVALFPKERQGDTRHGVYPVPLFTTVPGQSTAIAADDVKTAFGTHGQLKPKYAQQLSEAAVKRNKGKLPVGERWSMQVHIALTGLTPEDREMNWQAMTQRLLNPEGAGFEEVTFPRGAD